QYCRMEAGATPGSRPQTYPLPISRSTLSTAIQSLKKYGGVARRFLQRKCFGPVALLMAAILAGCATPSEPTLKIDRSIQAVSQSSLVSFVVLHYTVADTPRSLDILSKQNVSSHYLITDEDPLRVYQLVDESRRAWHAGESQWYGRSDLNAASIGVEIVNPGPVEGGWAPYSDTQIETLILLLRDVISRHQIHARNVVAHSDIAPQRKQDPGPAFPWKRLAETGIGRWYDESKVAGLKADYQRKGLPPVAVIQEKLRRAGYATPQSGVLDEATRRVL